MKQRTLGLGFFSLFIYLLGIYAIAAALLYIQAGEQAEFTVRLAFLDVDFDVMIGVQAFASTYLICGIALLVHPKRYRLISTTSCLGFWTLSASTFLFGMKFLLLILAFTHSVQGNMFVFLYQNDWFYFLFEWLMDLLFYSAVILFVRSLLQNRRKKKR